MRGFVIAERIDPGGTGKIIRYQGAADVKHLAGIRQGCGKTVGDLVIVRGQTDAQSFIQPVAEAVLIGRLQQHLHIRGLLCGVLVLFGIDKLEIADIPAVVILVMGHDIIIFERLRFDNTQQNQNDRQQKRSGKRRSYIDHWHTVTIIIHYSHLAVSP